MPIKIHRLLQVETKPGGGVIATFEMDGGAGAIIHEETEAAAIAYMTKDGSQVIDARGPARPAAAGAAFALVDLLNLKPVTPEACFMSGVSTRPFSAGVRR